MGGVRGRGIGGKVKGGRRARRRGWRETEGIPVNENLICSDFMYHVDAFPRSYESVNFQHQLSP